MADEIALAVTPVVKAKRKTKSKLGRKPNSKWQRIKSAAKKLVKELF